MQVRAKMLGIYDDKRVRENVVFNIVPETFNPYWMEPVDAEAKEYAAKRPKTAKKSEADRLKEEVSKLRAELAKK